MTGERPTLRARGVLLDLDGTVYQADRLIPGARDAIARLRAADLPLRFATNTTRIPRDGLVERLRGFGVAVEPDDIVTAPRVAAAWLAAHDVRRLALHVTEATAAEFAGFAVDDEAPDAVVVGDLGAGWSFERLNRAFRQVAGGARLVALQKNRYWRTGDGLTLDAGPFVAAIEFASGRSATVAGKPSAPFFRGAAASMGLEAADLLVVGDDVDSDVRGAMAAGARGVLVRTGKFRPADLDAAPAPDAVVDSVADVPRLLGLGG